MKYPEWLEPRALSLGRLAFSGDRKAFRLLGRIGGKVRAARLTSEQRSAIARQGGLARVAKMTAEQHRAWSKAAKMKQREGRA